MKTRVFIRDRTAVAGVIEFLLLVGLFAIVLSMIQLTYIPEVMKQKEADHMDEISNQFSRLKAMMDIQAQEQTNIPISTLITLGSSDLPYFVSAPSTGTIDIIDLEETESSIVINDLISIELTNINFDSNNIYFIPQKYILEGGGIIIKQPQGSPVMWADPSFNATPTRNANGQVTSIDMYFDIPLIKCSGTKNIGGLDSFNIITNYSDDLSDADWTYLSDISSINITTEYPKAWYNFTNSSFEKDVKNNITINQQPEHVRIEKKGLIEINLYYRKKCIYARID